MSAGTALVTGASSGIGAVYCERLAARGHDLIMVARHGARMEAAAARLRVTGRNVEVLVADLTDRAQCGQVSERLAEDAAITMLVNNAGMSLRGGWLETTEAEIEQLLTLNALAPTLLARAAARNFEARGRGAIVNIASVLALALESSDGAYSGTKAYLLNLTHALAERFAGTNIRVQAVLPCATRTEIFARSGKNLNDYPAEWVMEPEDLVDAALAGLDRGETVTIPSLADEALWSGALAARRALLPYLQNRHVAERYR